MTATLLFKGLLRGAVIILASLIAQSRPSAAEMVVAISVVTLISYYSIAAEGHDEKLALGNIIYALIV